ncbi:hypothetical protein DPMN_042150 [Dreissena polymorpha]|uniref:Uncharacterized protein n=1 Tax=Dreissena polymorpha TaxID=45954 RepID=A0A9D4CZ17_DREPO|nr:hypothetical protein DPMN_042150 [Dreissena polymorpha]
MLHMKFNVYKLFTDRQTDGRTLSDHNSSPRAIAQVLMPPIIPCYSTDRNHFKLNSHIKETNVLTKFHENLAKNVTSRVFTCFHYIHIEKNAPPTGGHVFSPIWTLFELVRDINKTNVLTNFHDDWAKIVTSRVLTRKTAPPPPGSHVIQLTGTIFELNSHIKETNVLAKFHEI